MEKNALLGISEESEEKSLDPFVYKQLQEQIANLYRATKQKNDRKVDEAVETKIQNSSMLQLIEEAEYALNRFNEEFEWIQKHHGDTFMDIAKKLKKKNLRESIEKNNKIQEEKTREM